jgi:hypothetical protein
VRDLNRPELVGECGRAALEATSAANPGWVERVLEVGGWADRCRACVDTWRLPTSKTKNTKKLAIAVGLTLAVTKILDRELNGTRVTF